MPGTGLRESLSWLKREIYGGWKHKVSGGNLDRDPHIDSDGKSWVNHAIQPVAVIKASNGQIVDPITAQVVQPDRTNIGNVFKTYDVNVNDRYMGELLLEDDLIDVSGGAAVNGTAFNTRGYQYLLVTYAIPAMATNPVTLRAQLQISTDAFDTTAFDVMALDGEIIVQTLTVADNDMRAFFLCTMSNAGAVAATNTPHAAPIPDIDGITARLVITPTGAAVTNEAITFNVYGITSR